MECDYNGFKNRMGPRDSSHYERAGSHRAPLQDNRAGLGVERDHPGTKLETLGEHFGLTEGPVWIQEGKSGHLLFSDCAANVIYKWAPGSNLSVFLESSGYTGKDNLNVGPQTVSGGRVSILLIGSNGLALDPQGRSVITAMADRSVVRLEKDGKRTMLADRYDGKRFSGPNDVTVKSDGAVYFTDSVNGLRGGGVGPARELTFNGLYLVKDGRVTLLGGDKDQPGDFPNGITLSPDEKHLYVTAGPRKTLRYDVLPDDTVANPKVFLDAGNDRMKVDRGWQYVIYYGLHSSVSDSSEDSGRANERKCGC
jgi:gluconolactonase